MSTTIGKGASFGGSAVPTIAGIEGQDVNSDINVTPMIDVMLVLLIIFMVITPAMAGYTAILPKAVTLCKIGPEGTTATFDLTSSGPFGTLTTPVTLQATSLTNPDVSKCAEVWKSVNLADPTITVPRGLIGDWRGGLTFIGPSCSDASVIGYAYAYEQTGPFRIVPNLQAQLPEGTPEPGV